MSSPNVEVVQEIYVAFGRQDIPAILERLHEDVKWNEHHGTGELPPWLVPRQGHEGVAQFFRCLSELEYETYIPYAFLDDEPYVVALLNVAFTIKETGTRIENDAEAHLWEFDEDGRVRSLRHLVDTHAHFDAWRGAAS
jgi:ketosteroid isomerase-like protein